MSRADEHAFGIPTVALPNGNWEYGAPGLTIREYFAALAMQGLLAGEAGSPDGHWIPETLAVQAVRRADALIAELAKPVSP